MQRRSFLRTSLAAAGTLAAGATVSEAADSKPAEFYELRAYTLPARNQALLDNYLSNALAPTLKRYGIGPVGVFTEKPDQDPARVYVLIVYSSPEQAAGLSARLAGDEDYRKAAGDYLAARAADPVYRRIDSSLLAPIEGLPKLVRPDTSRPRLLNLRIYESHNE